tara:strand:+ start:164 stop:337 length:174 start_codon:yes stop_codon:yes gene_type:complete
MLNKIKYIIMNIWKKDKVMIYQDKVYGKFIESLGKPKTKKATKKVKVKKDEEPHLFI